MCKIAISETTAISELKEWFSSCFPLLKIEIYSKKHDTGEGNSSSELIQNNAKLSELGYKGGAIDFVIFEDYSTNLAEHIFFSKLNINAQIFRLNKNTWIQTISTDNWTLKEQMIKAQEYQEGNVA
jgi:uncharacterized SAM-binding protein YcdF (DUF218 family)